MKLIKSYLIKNKVVIREEAFKEGEKLYNRSRFGEIVGKSNKRIELPLIEALYLSEKEKLEIYFNNSKLSFEDFVKKATRIETNFMKRYIVYKDLRNIGYILKTALKFGADFRVYAKGAKPGKGHADWILYCVSENDKFSWRDFAAKNRVAHSTRKKLLVGCVDEDNDVTYWEIGWKKP